MPSVYDEKCDHFHGVPSVEQVDAFMDTINTGRKAAGLPPFVTVEVWEKIDGHHNAALFEFDECEPGQPYSCLSATNFAMPLGFTSGSSHFRTYDKEKAVTTAMAMDAIGAEADHNFEVPGFARTIPAAIRAVTDPFDTSERGEPFEFHNEEVRLYRAIREVFVEAGWIEA